MFFFFIIRRHKLNTLIGNLFYNSKENNLIVNLHDGATGFIAVSFEQL